MSFFAKIVILIDQEETIRVTREKVAVSRLCCFGWVHGLECINTASRWNRMDYSPRRKHFWSCRCVFRLCCLSVTLIVLIQFRLLPPNLSLIEEGVLFGSISSA